MPGNIQEQARVAVFLDGRDAEQTLQELTSDVNKYTDALHRAYEAGDKNALKKASSDLRKAEKDLQSFKKQTFEVSKVLNDLNGSSFNDLVKAERQLRGEMKGLRRDTDEYTKTHKDWKKVKAEIDKATGSAKGMSKGMMLLKSAIPVVTIGALISGIVAGTKKLFQMADATFELRKEIQQLTDLQGKELADFTASVDASAKTFEVDVKELAIGTNSFAKSMGLAHDQAQALIDDGFIAGANASGEYLSILREYGPQFKAAGLSAGQTISIITQQVKDGIFSDKGVDTIKEGMLRLREMPNATREALDNIGISSKELMQQLRSGEITVFEAMQRVSNRLAELPPQSSEVGTAIADIFGGPGEDAGLEFIKMLGTAELSMDKLKEQTGETADAQELMLKANKELGKAWSDLLGSGTGGFTKLRAQAKLFLAEGIMGIIKGTRDMRNGFAEFYNDSAPLRAFLATLGLSFKTQINFAITSLKTFWETLKTVGKLTKAVFSGDFKSIGTILKEGFNGIADDISDSFRKGSEDFQKFKDTIKNGRIELKPIKQDVELNYSENNASATSVVKQLTKESSSAIKLRQSTLEKIAELEDEYYRAQATKNEKEIEDIQRKYEAEIEAAMAAKVSKDDIAQLEMLRDQEINDALGEQFKEFEARKAAYRSEYNLLTLEELQVTELEKLQEGYELKLIAEEEYQTLKSEIEQKYRDLENEKESANLLKKIEERREFIATISSINSLAFESLSNLRNAELTQIETNKQRELKLAGDNADRKADIEEKYNAQASAIRKRYAKAELLANVISAIAENASAIAQIWAQSLVMPDSILTFGATGSLRAGIITGLLVAKTATQIAVAKQQYNQTSQLAKGKYPVIGADDNRLYHADYHGPVTSSGIINRGRPTLINETPGEMILTAPHTRRLQLNPALYNQVMSLRYPQRAEGSYPQTQAPAQQQADPELVQAVKEFRAVVASLRDDPIKAYTVLQEQRDAESRMQELEKFAKGN